MGRRLQLQALLEQILNSRNVYFQPPESFLINYPCIVYSLDSASVKYADNFPYRHTRRYQITVLDSSPDSVIPDAMDVLPQCTFLRHFTTEGLHHFIYDLYF